MVVEILILLALLVVNGLFAMTELAVLSSRRTRLQQLSDEGSRGAREALALLDEPTRFLSTVQIGITLIGVLAGVYSGASFAGPLERWMEAFGLFAGYAGPVAYGVVVVSVTYLSLVIGELVPKRWALGRPEAIATAVAPTMRRIATASAPIVWLLQRSTDLVLRILGLRKSTRSSISEEEIRAMIAEGTREGVFHRDEHRMIEGVLRLADRNLRSIMMPRGDIQWLDADDSREAVWDTVRMNSHSRYLVCRGDIDELVGVVQIPDLLDWVRDPAGDSLEQRVTAPFVVQETTTILRLLELFAAIEGRQQRDRLAVRLWRNACHDSLGMCQATGFRFCSAHRGHQLRGNFLHGPAFLERLEPLLDELAREGASGTAERRAGETKGEAFDVPGMPRIRFLGNEPPHAVADQHHRAVVERADQPDESSRHLLEIVGRYACAFAVAGLIPRMCAVAACREERQLGVPCVMSPADPVQEYQRGQASSPASFPFSTMILPSSRIVQLRNGRS